MVMFGLLVVIIDYHSQQDTLVWQYWAHCSRCCTTEAVVGHSSWIADRLSIHEQGYTKAATIQAHRWGCSQKPLDAVPLLTSSLKHHFTSYRIEENQALQQVVSYFLVQPDLSSFRTIIRFRHIAVIKAWWRRQSSCYQAKEIQRPHVKKLQAI